MYHVISLIVVLISISNRLSAQTYEDADCNGEICFLGRGVPSIECTPMAVSNSPYVITPPLTGGDPVWSAVAVNPIDGQIYVLYQEDGAGATVYLGTIEDPYSDTAPFDITRIGDGLATETYTALTFDCEGNAYGVTSGRDPTIIQLDLTTGTEIATVDALNESYSTCNPFVECRELIMYNYDTDEFIRISTAADNTVDKRLYVRSSIEGPDDPLNGTLIDYNGVCAANADITTATYIGNGIALVYCGGSTDNPAILDMTDINNPILRAEALSVGTTDALLTYNADGSVCKPPSCTTTPTTSPPTTSPSSPSPVMGGYSSDSESDSESDSDRGSGRGSERGSDSDSSGLTPTRRPRNGNKNRNRNGSGSGSGSGDGAEMFQNAADMGYADENEENMSDLITVDVSDKTVLHFWGLFAVFSVVNIVGCWCIFKRDTKKLKFVTPKPPSIDL